jgi:hypothetical protein
MGSSILENSNFENTPSCVTSHEPTEEAERSSSNERLVWIEAHILDVFECLIFNSCSAGGKSARGRRIANLVVCSSRSARVVAKGVVCVFADYPIGAAQDEVRSLTIGIFESSYPRLGW